MALSISSPCCSMTSSTFQSNHHHQIPTSCSSLAVPPIFKKLVSSIAPSKRKRCHSLPIQSSSSPPPEGVPTELVEDSKFVPLNAEDPVFGPPALLLIGFEAGETDKIWNFLKELDGDFLKVIHCTEEMVKKTVWDAMQSEQPNLESVKIAKSLPRICFFSGLSGEEMIIFIDAFPETGLETAIFAALVPNSVEKILGEVIEEIVGDHEMLNAEKSDNIN